jgi:iron complex transport system ATP-binding protein
MNAVALACETLRWSWGARAVVDGVTLDLQRGQWCAIVGPNGAGKSTLLSLWAGLRPPEVGQVWLAGKALTSWSAQQRARQLVWLGQADAAPESSEMAAIDAVRLGRLPRHGLFGAVDANDERVVQAVMCETECEAFALRRLSQLSGGERQRVMLARALAGEAAAVWLFDEPTSHLDAPHQRALVHSLRRRAKADTAVVTVLHDLNLALAADRIVLLDQGRVAADGVPGDANLHAALVRSFGGAFSIRAINGDADALRWVALPKL